MPVGWYPARLRRASGPGASEGTCGGTAATAWGHPRHLANTAFPAHTARHQQSQSQDGLGLEEGLQVDQEAWEGEHAGLSHL